MLVLTRKAKQSIQIGEGVRVTVTKVRGNTVQIGIEAPEDVSIVRSELLFRDEPNLDDNLAPTTQQVGSHLKSATVESTSKSAVLDLSDVPVLSVVRPDSEPNSAPLGSFVRAL